MLQEMALRRFPNSLYHSSSWQSISWRSSYYLAKWWRDHCWSSLNCRRLSQRSCFYAKTTRFAMMEPNRRGVLVICLSVALGVIDTLAVILRFIARRKSESGLAMDDWLIALSLVPAYCMIIIAGFCESVSSWTRRICSLTHFLFRGLESRSGQAYRHFDSFSSKIDPQGTLLVQDVV